MKDWLRDEIDTVKARCAKAERKLKRRELDDKTKEEQRPKVWAALVAELQESVTHFNASIKPANSLGFTERDQMVAVSKNDYPKGYLHVEFREGLNDILFGFSRTERLGASAIDRKDSFEFDVDDDGNLILLLGNTSLTVDDVAAMLLRPIFQCVC